MKIQIILLLTLMIGACESHRSKFDKKIKLCEVAELNGIMVTAGESCQSALEIADSNNFSPTLKSLAMYRLGSIKRKQGEFIEAEKLLSRSLVFEEQQKTPSSLEIGRRLLELSLCMAGQKRWDEGTHFLQRLLPVINQLSEKERLIAGNTLKHYATKLIQTNQSELATQFVAKARKIM